MYINLEHTGIILKEEFIDAYGMSQNALAKAINVPANRIHEIVKEKRKITADTDLRLTKYFSLSEGCFLKLQNDYEIRKTKREMSKELEKIHPLTMVS